MEIKAQVAKTGEAYQCNPPSEPLSRELDVSKGSKVGD
jgi:hypothetical protein